MLHIVGEWECARKIRQHYGMYSASLICIEKSPIQITRGLSLLANYAVGMV